VESLDRLSLEECGEGVEDTFRERGYSEGEKDSKKREKGFFRQLRMGEGKLSRNSDTTMAAGKTILKNCFTFNILLPQSLILTY
jgi:hypothetical protein